MRKQCRWGFAFQESGYRFTASREAIIDVLNNSSEHLSAEDIYMAVHGKHSGIGLTTIYRTLDLLGQMGVVNKFEFGHGKAKYELSEKYGHKAHHHHLICKNCRNIIDYTEFFDEELEYIRKAEKGLHKKYGYDIDEHIIHFYGQCPECKTMG